MRKVKPEWIIEYQDTFGVWQVWNETTAFSQKTFMPVFFTKKAAQICIETIRLEPIWNKKPFRVRRVSIIKTKDSSQCE